MGNEESQQGGAQGPQQQGAPGTFGMGQPQQPARFGGPPGPMGPPPGMRQVAPTGGPNLRPGGPGPPQATRGPFPGGGPRQPQQAGPARPVQVGVQPWAEPPVQQPAQFRGPSPRPSMMQPPQQPVQKAVVQPPKVQPQPEMDIGVDLSNLSEEEKARILSVMARAQDLDQDYERHKRAKEEPSEVRPQLLCPLCQRVDLAVETNKMCGDCGKNFCQKCGTFVPGEGRRSVWVCNTCSDRRKQEQLRKEQEQQRLQQQGNTTGTGQMVAGGPSRKDGTMSRMGQPFQNLQQQQQQPGGQQQLPGAQVQQQPSVSLLGTGTSGGGSLMSGSLIPSSAVGGGGTLPGTVPLTAVSQQQWPQNTQQQQWPNMQTTMQQQQPMMQGGGGTQQTMVMTQQLQPKAVDMMTPQQQQQQKQQVGSGLMMKKGEQSSSSGWSPVTDLSPILDVSPSLGAAEQELMGRCVQQDQQLRPGGIPRAQSGTISSLLADFNRSVGQTTPTIDDGSRSLTIMQQPQQQTQQQTHQQVQMQQQQPVGTASMTASQQKTALSTGGTEMDQNQNLVQQHQFQLQQQQLMIQQQQQVIQQQQAQLQQQMQQQQIQTQQYQTQQQQQQQQVMMQHDMAQQQHSMQMQQPQQTMTTSLVPQQQQQQPGMVVAGTPMQQQQAPSQRKVHGRLPQPTVDQMQAAVALAAQTPRSKSQSSNRGMQPSIGGFHRPVSPVIIAGTTSTSAASLGVATAQHLPSAVSPTPRRDLSETTLSLDGIDGVGGKKVRRRLPPVPLDQEPTTVPLRRIKDRNRTLSMPLSTSADRGAWDTRRMPQRTTSLDDGMSLTMKTSTGSILDTLGLASHTSTDTYLKLLGILASTTTTTTTTTTSILDSIPSSIGLSTSLLGRRDLSAPHSLSLYRDVSSTSGSYLLDSEPKLPSYLLSLKQQLREGLGSVSDHNRRRITDPGLSGLLSHSTWPSDTSSYDPLRKLGSSSASTLPLTGGSRLAARRSRHRRHASDTKLATLSLGREEALDDPLMSRYKLYQGGSTMPFKSYEFESIDDHLGPSYGYSSGGRHHHYPPRRRSSLTDMNDLTGLRDTALNTALGHTSRSSTTDQALRRYNREIARLRRHTDTGLGSLSLSSLGLDPYGRHNSATYGRGVNVRPAASRSWHPSPYVSEDEDEREEKKAKIKAEIARRRQHLEESARLHDPMYKMSAGYPTASSYDRLYGSPVGSFADDPDLLMMRRDAYRTNLNYPAYPATYPSYRSSSTRYGDVSSWPYDPYAYADDLVDPYDLDVYSPLDPDSDPLVAPMPLLPDMPTRSRRLLHDLGSTPLGPTRHHQSRAGVSSSRPYEDYEGRVDEPPPRHHRSGGTRPPPQSTSERDVRKAQSSKTSQKYDFPVKRILLTRDPKDRSVGGNGLGMKVVGGKEIPGSNGMIGAYVARIYPGGVVETLGEVREGDQVLEWNGTSLTGKTYEEVQRIIATSGDEVEIVIRSDFNMLSSRSSSHHHPNRHHHHEQQNHPESRLSRSGGHHQHSTPSRSAGGSSSYHHQQQQHSQPSYRTSRDRYDEYAVRSPTEEGVRNSNCLEERCGSVSPTRHHPRIGSPVGKADTTDNKEKYRAEDISGEIQLQVCYDSKASILYVTIVRARNLVTSRDNSGLPDPYVKCYLLPDRRVENQRRTRYFSRCSNPEWKQTMVYPQVPQDQLKKKYLEISVWNYDINGPPEFLGETILDLKDTSVIDEQSRWYKLHPHDPKKYPSQSLNNEGAMKMARLNNPNKNALYLDNDDIRKQQHTA